MKIAVSLQSEREKNWHKLKTNWNKLNPQTVAKLLTQNFELKKKKVNS